MSILGIILTVAFILWMPISIWMLYRIYRSNKEQTQLMEETLVAASKTASENAVRSVKTAQQLATMLTDEEHTHHEEGDVPPPV
jgi:hypothetical protein